MQKFAFKWFKNLFPPFLGFFLIYYSYSNTTLDDRKTIYLSILNANYFFVLFKEIEIRRRFREQNSVG